MFNIFLFEVIFTIFSFRERCDIKELWDTLTGVILVVFEFIQHRRCRQPAAAGCLEAENAIGCFKSGGCRRLQAAAGGCRRLQATLALHEVERT